MANSFVENQAQKHAEQIFDLTGRYFCKHSPEAAEKLKELYNQTCNYYDQGCNAYDGVLALHAHVLALWNVNEHFNLSLALAYSHLAEECYEKFLHSAPISAMPEVDQRVYRSYLKHVRLVCAYVDYSNDNLYGAQQWLQKIGAEDVQLSTVALMAVVLFRLTMEEGREDFLAPFNMFRAMDQMFTKPVNYLFEEDILRTAYGFYELYYTHGVCDQAESVPYNPSLAAEILSRAYVLFKDPQQKEWMLDNINDAKGKC